MTTYEEKRAAVVAELLADGGLMEGHDGEVSDEQILETLVDLHWRKLETGRINVIRSRILGQRDLSSDDKATLKDLERQLDDLGVRVPSRSLEEMRIADMMHEITDALKHLRKP